MSARDSAGYIYVVNGIRRPRRLEIKLDQGFGKFLVNSGVLESRLHGEDFELQKGYTYRRYKFDASLWRFVYDLEFTIDTATVNRESQEVVVDGEHYTFNFLGLFSDPDDLSVFLVGKSMLAKCPAPPQAEVDDRGAG